MLATLTKKEVIERTYFLVFSKQDCNVVNCLDILRMLLLPAFITNGVCRSNATGAVDTGRRYSAPQLASLCYHKRQFLTHPSHTRRFHGATVVNHGVASTLERHAQHACRQTEAQSRRPTRLRTTA